MKRNTKQKKEAPKNGLLILGLLALYKWLQKAWAGSNHSTGRFYKPHQWILYLPWGTRHHGKK